MLIPGTTLLPKGVLAIAYFIFLAWLFLGISIVADIFMEAIEEITSQETTVEYTDPKTNKSYEVTEKIWNPTIANLTLMALGSSAPEILLAVIEALQNLGKPAGPLGASTIVGSAAFNLLVISAVAVVAVDEPKYVLDMYVFTVTSLMSIFAYLWLYICLDQVTPNEVTLKEAWLTIVFFIILVIMAFSADRWNAMQMKKNETEADKKRAAEQLEKKKMKKELTQFVTNFASIGGEQTVIEVATNCNTANTKKVNDQDKNSIIKLFCAILEVKDQAALIKLGAGEMSKALKPDSLLERFAARKDANFKGEKEFLSLAGT